MTTKIDIIIIVGSSGVGKDLSSDYLSKKLGWVVYALATPVKEIASIALNLPLKYFHDIDKKECSVDIFGKTGNQISPREMMQIVYKDCFTNVIGKYLPEIAPLYFVYHMENKFNLKKKTNIHTNSLTESGCVSKAQHPVKLILSDCRNPIYVNYLQLNYNCLTIKITRPGVAIKNHISESEITKIENIDYNIDNNSTISELYNKIDKIIYDLV